MLIRAMWVLMLCAGVVQAQDAAVTGSGMAHGLSENALKKLRAAPEVFLQDAAVVIYGFGGKGGIDRAGIETFIAAERAKVRAREMARYLVADLNNDGDISRQEMAIFADAAPAAKRGRLQRGYDQADGDTNGLLTVAELRGYGQSLAVAQLTDAEADDFRALLRFDQDGNGSAAMDEVAAGVSALIEGS